MVTKLQSVLTKMVYFIGFKLSWNSARFSITRTALFALIFTSILNSGCNCLCDDPQPEPYQMAFLFRDSLDQNILGEQIGEEIKLYFLEESSKRELVQTWKIEEFIAESGQVDFFYSSQCEEYQQFFEIEFSGKIISGNFKAKPFYEPKTCCAKYCFSGVIYYQKIQNRIETRPSYSGVSIFFKIIL